MEKAAASVFLKRGVKLSKALVVVERHQLQLLQLATLWERLVAYSVMWQLGCSSSVDSWRLMLIQYKTCNPCLMPIVVGIWLVYPTQSSISVVAALVLDVLNLQAHHTISRIFKWAMKKLLQVFEIHDFEIHYLITVTNPKHSQEFFISKKKKRLPIVHGSRKTCIQR